MRITPETKDLVLNYLLDNYEVGSLVCLSYETNIHGVTGDTLEAMIRQFEKLGLIRFDKKGSFTNTSIIFWINMDANDLSNEGGFHGKFQIFQSNIAKLYLELDKVEPKDVKKGHDIKEIRTAVKDYADIITKASTLATIIKTALL